MENIKYEITEEDIKNYLNNHSKDKLIKFREALFVKYMKHHDMFTREKLEILINKDHYNRTLFDASVIIDDSGLYPIYGFSDFLEHQTIDTSAYMHILIPILGYYKDRLGLDLCLTNGEIEKYLPKIDLNDYECGKLADTIENYKIAGKINNINTELVEKIGDINMSKTECNNELSAYSMIYGIEPIERIKKLVKEG